MVVRSSTGYESGAGQLVTTTATIENGASLSDAIDCSLGRLAHIEMPASWTTANLTLQASDALDGTYNNLYDSFGTEYAIIAAASRSIIVPLADFLGVRYLKVRSGTAGTPVNQGAEREIVLTLAP